jgi:hypothetical protein
VHRAIVLGCKLQRLVDLATGGLAFAPHVHFEKFMEEQHGPWLPNRSAAFIIVLVVNNNNNNKMRGGLQN